MEFLDGSNTTTVRVLGEFKLTVNGCVVPLALREQRLLALLCVNGPGPRGYVSGTLWPETTQDRAALSLRVSAHAIRGITPDLLDIGRRDIGLSPQVRSDLQMLRQCLADDDDQDLHARLMVLSRGNLLTGWGEDWVIHHRERLRHRRIRALAVMAQRCLDSGNPKTALAAARAARRLEPLRERIHGLEVQALLQLGLDTEAVARQQTFTQRMERELGVSPSEKTLRLIATG